MPLSLSPEDRIVSPERPAGRRTMRLLTYGLIVPITLACLAIAGWYIITGDMPFHITGPFAEAPRIDMPMPPKLVPAAPSQALLQPPVTAAPAELQPVPPQPTAPAPAKANAGPTVASLPPPPPLNEPVIPPGGDLLATPTFAQLPARTDLKPLATAPLSDLLRNSSLGPLPVASSGREARMAYARPFPGDAKQPRIAVVITGLGLSHDATEAAISKLPPDISLSFSPYAGNLDVWIKKARAAGHETLLDLPLEPPNFPVRDGGPLAILAHYPPAEAITHLQQIMVKATGYVGFAGALRSPVAASEQWVPILRDIKERGLLFVGDGLVGVPERDVPSSATVTLVADDPPFRTAIDARLARVQTAAERDGSAVVYTSPRPVTFERLLAWSSALPQRGIILAPVSAVVRP